MNADWTKLADAIVKQSDGFFNLIPAHESPYDVNELFMQNGTEEGIYQIIGNPETIDELFGILDANHFDVTKLREVLG